LAKNNPERAEALAALMLTAKGVPFVYYGEEIGMENIEANSLDEMMDIQARTHYKIALKNGKPKEQAIKIGNDYNRGKSRSPMQWNDGKYGGFSNEKAWIKVNHNHMKVNVENLEKNKSSLLNKYKKLISLRNSEKVLQYGQYAQLSFLNNLIMFTRSFNGERIKCYFNFGENSKEIILKKNETVLIGELKIEPNNYLIIK